VVAADALAQAIVDFLAAGLAEAVYGGCAPSQPHLDEGGARTIDVEFIEFATAREAIQHSRGREGLVAVLWGGRNRVVRREDADRLATSGAFFAYLSEHRGRIMTVPVND
jgi:hypothetical protein